MLYQNEFEIWEFDKEAPQNFCLDRTTIAERQGTSEDRNFKVKPTGSKTNFRIHFGIKTLRTCLTFLILFVNPIHAAITTGIDNLLDGQYNSLLKGKRVGLITNHTALNKDQESTIAVLKTAASKVGFTLTALFAPEHGINGSQFAYAHIEEGQDCDKIPIFSLHGSTRKPTPEMLSKIDTLIYDIQDVGARSYTYVSTLFYAMEEAAKADIRVIVLDRPNPINGTTIDGPMMEEKWRSFVGYINVPYCHGMTVGELARFFNEEYKAGCTLSVIPMKGWKRSMTFEETGLPWIPTSPQIPEASTPWFYPATGILGELSIVSVGGGCHLPYKVVGAPWIDAEAFAQALNAQKFAGVHFVPFHFKPFYGSFVEKECHGVLILITDHSRFLPVTTQYLIMGILKSLYPQQVKEVLKKMEKRKTQVFCQVLGTEEVWKILNNEPYPLWKMREIHRKEREAFLKKREKYLIQQYRD